MELLVVPRASVVCPSRDSLVWSKSWGSRTWNSARCALHILPPSAGQRWSALSSPVPFFFAFFYRKPRVEVFKEPYWLLAPLIILILFFYREGCFVVVVVFNIYSPFSPWFFWCPFLILPHSPGIFCFVFFLAAVHSFFSLFLSRKVSADLSSVSTPGGFRCRVRRCCDFRSTPFLAPAPLPPSPASSCTLSRFSARAVLH